MLFKLGQRFTHLPVWARLCLGILVAVPGIALVLGIFALVAQGPGEFNPFGPEWRLATLGLFAVLTIVITVLGNVLSQRYLDWERRLPGIRTFFQSHDLARLVGQALGMILRNCEPRLRDPQDARLVLRLARQAEADWPVIAAGDLARRFLAQIQELV